MRDLIVAQHGAAVTEALAVLTAVTTTQAGVGRRNALTTLLFELEESFEFGDPRLPLRWIAIERERESARDIANMLFAVSHVLARRILGLEPGKHGEALTHFQRVRAHAEHALQNPQISFAASA